MSDLLPNAYFGPYLVLRRGRGRHHRQLVDLRQKEDAGNGQKGGVVRFATLQVTGKHIAERDSHQRLRTSDNRQRPTNRLCVCFGFPETYRYWYLHQND